MSASRFLFEENPEDQPQAPEVDGGDAYEPLDLTQITEAELLVPN